MNIKTTQELTLRFPLVLTLVMAFLALRAATRMSESGSGKEKIALDLPNRADAIKQAFKLTFQAGAWILKTPFALVVILSGLLFDHVIRMLITMSSQYYRSIYLPEASFGLIGSGLSVIGLFVPALARRMARRFSPVFNFCILSALTFAGLLATSFVIPYAGLIPMIVLFALMMLVGFFVSYYLNQVSESSQRATVLSFKGLSLNLAYGFIGILYSFLLAGLRHQAAGAPAIANGPGLESLVFVRSLGWFPWYFAAAAVAVCLFSWRRLKAVDLKAEDIQGQPPAERPPPMP